MSQLYLVAILPANTNSCPTIMEMCLEAFISYLGSVGLMSANGNSYVSSFLVQRWEWMWNQITEDT